MRIICLLIAVSPVIALLGDYDKLSGSRPNILFFLSDDQSRFDHSAYGNDKAPTPTTDAFSREALVFEKAFTGQAICAPSRSMLYSGLYPIRHGCFINHTSVRPGVKTVPAYLKPLGYEVILAGKSHVKPSNQFQWSDWFPPVQKEGMPRPSIPLTRMEGYFKSADKPFCMLVTSEYPHGPYFEESPFDPDEVSLPPYRRDVESTRRDVTRYYASIAEKERELAAVLALLKKYDLEGNTIVFYSDDHGASRGKFTVYDSGLNVAFMVRWPGKIQPGRTDALTSFADFVPTVIELAGGDVPSGLDGMSLLPILENRNQHHHSFVYGVTHNQGIQNRHVFPQRSVHDGRYHYIFNFNSVERIERERAAGKAVDFFLELGANKHPQQGEEELYDTLNDPHEMENLASAAALGPVKARLRKQLFHWMQNQHDFLTEDGEIPFLKVLKHELDEQAPEFNYAIPEEMVGSLDGKKRDPHMLTAQQ